MGRVYKYHCDACDFEADYYVGGGFFSEEYLEETKALAQQLENSIKEGKYGILLQAMAQADESKELFFDCGEDLFQCDSCKALIVCRGKMVLNKQFQFHAEYHISAEIDIQCPECSDGILKRVVNYFALCPKCKKELLKLRSLGLWD